MEEVLSALKQPKFNWLPKHLNHIAEKIAIDKRNISFLAINALFRQKNYQLARSPKPFKQSYIIAGYVEKQKNDQLRTTEEELFVIFRIGSYGEIIVITAYSETDEK